MERGVEEGRERESMYERLKERGKCLDALN